MRTTRWISRVILAASLGGLLLTSAQLQAQGKGKGHSGDDKHGQRKGKENKDGKDQARLEARSRGDNKDLKAGQKSDQKGERGKAISARKVERDVGGAVALPRVVRDSRNDGDSDSKRGKNRLWRSVIVDDLRPSLRRFYLVDRAPERVLVGAVSRAHLRGLDDDLLVITPVNNRVRLLNRSGVLLLDMDENRARKVGKWDVLAVNDRVKEGAPAFCRSGAGHPVFGRDWCIEKGFGLGVDRDLRWGRTRIDDVVFTRRVNSNGLAGDALLALLGPTAFDRLALHAVTLGFAEPLSGLWLDDPSGPRVLLLNSGSFPIAEIVDSNRDDRPEVLLVSRRDW